MRFGFWSDEMNNKQEDWINEVDKAGDELIEKILKPIAKGTADFVIKDNKLAQAFLSLKTAFMGNKIFLFLKYINDIEDEEAILFINELNSKEKKFFIESVNKVIDLDDDLQIYILAYLVKVHKINNKLNYYEKQLFYNISTFSKDDFKIYYCVYSDNREKNRDFFCLSSYVRSKTETMSISLNKFAHLGLIHIETSTRQDEQKNISNHISYTLSEYSKTLFSCLEAYFMNESCDDIIEKIQYAKIKGGFIR